MQPSEGQYVAYGFLPGCYSPSPPVALVPRPGGGLSAYAVLVAKKGTRLPALQVGVWVARREGCGCCTFAGRNQVACVVETRGAACVACAGGRKCRQPGSPMCIGAEASGNLHSGGESGLWFPGVQPSWCVVPTSLEVGQP